MIRIQIQENFLKTDNQKPYYNQGHKIGGKELDYLRWNTTNVKASTTKGTTFLNTSSFKAKLSCFNGGDITTRTTTDDDNIILIGSRRKVTREGRERKCVAKRIGRVAKVSGN